MKKIEIKTEAVIFDMDGVITHTMPDHYRAWKQIFAEHGLKVSFLDVYKREGQTGISSVMELFEEKDVPLTKSQAARLVRDKEKLFKQIVRVRFIPGARTFLKELHRAGFRLALVTGTSRPELHRILPDALYDLFEDVVTGNDVTHGKPHPEPYRKALKALKISPRRAVVVENAPLGIESAKKAGLCCLAIETSLPREYLSQADYEFDSVKDLRGSTRFILTGKRAGRRT